MSAPGFRVAELRLRYATEDELSERVGDVTPSSLKRPGQAARVARLFLADRATESFLVLAVDARHRLLHVHEVSSGTIDSCPVHPREVFRTAVMAGAAAVIVAHNHPTGDTAPSLADAEVTKRLRSAGQIIGIPVLDHVIVGLEDYTSLRECGPWPTEPEA